MTRQPSPLLPFLLSLALLATVTAVPASAQTPDRIVLQPGEEWSGGLRLDGTLAIEARLLWENPAGANYVLEVIVNGRPITGPLLNKMSPMRYADGRNYPYRQPNAARWLLFYSHDYAANNGPAGGGYEVRTDPGQAYRYVWNVAPMLGGNPTAQVRFTNSSNPPVPIELRLLPSEPLNRYTTTSPPPTTPAEPSKPKGGLFGGLVDALKEVAKGVATQPSTTAGVTPPAYPPPTTSPVPYGSSSAQGVPHLAVYTVPTLLGGGRPYALVVQLQDGSGRPMYPAAPLTVTVTSSDPRIVTAYGSDRRPTATLTLRPADPGRSVGLSWDAINIMPASASVAGTVTLTATAPGLPGGSATVTVVPTRTTPGNLSTPAETAAGASLRLIVLPPITETNRLPLAEVELLDARGQPTAVDSPGGWTLESSNPAVMERYSSSGNGGQFHYPRAPGQTQLTVISKRPGVTGSSATLTAIAPGSTTTTTTERAVPPSTVAVAPPLPMPAPAPTGTIGRVAPRSDFGEPAITGRISNIVTARDVQRGVAIDITDTFNPDVNPIHVWFRLAGFSPGTTLTSRWTYLGGAQPLVIGTGEFTVAPTNDYGTFSYELAAGKRWPAGEYRIEILLDGAVLGSATFTVRPAQSSVPSTHAAPADDARALAAIYYELALREAVRARDTGEWEALQSAGIAAETATELQPDRADYWVLLGDLYRQMPGSVSRVMADDAFERAVTLDPRHLAARLALGQLKFDDGFYASALDQFEVVAREIPHAVEPGLVAMMNIAYLQDRQYARGVTFWRAHLGTAPEADVARLALAIVLNDRKDLTAARTELGTVANRPGASAANREYARTLLQAWARQEIR